MKLIYSVIAREILMMIYFPLWWYTRGIAWYVHEAAHVIGVSDVRFGFSIWIRNVFTPMYGQRDIVGRIISFFARVFNSIFRGFGLLIVVLVMIGGLGVWLIAPVFIIARIFFYLT